MVDYVTVGSGEREMTYEVDKLHAGIDNEDYHAGPGISKSQLTTLLEYPPSTLLHNITHPEHKDSHAKKIGSAVHTAILEPDEFSKRYCEEVKHTGKGSVALNKEFKETCAEQNLIPISKEDFETVQAMGRNVRAHRLAAPLLENGTPELSGYFNHDDGVLARFRPDFIPEGHNVIVDLKSSQFASYSMFGKAVNNYYYHVQDALYSDGMKKITGEYWAFLFVVVENVAPYNVALYELDADAKNMGATLYRSCMRTYAEAKNNNKWEAYPNEIRRLTLPPWAQKLNVI